MKKYSTLLAAVILLLTKNNAQSVGINNSTPHASAVLDVKSTNKGVLIPRLTQAQRLAIASPAKGLLVYDSTSNSFWYRNGAAWQELGSGGGSANAWSLTGNSGTDTANFLGTTDNVSLQFRVNNVWAGEINHSISNTSLGYGAGEDNFAGGNVAIGEYALYKSGGGSNTAVGVQTLYNNVNGYYNTAYGAFALNSNTTGNFNIGIGFGASSTTNLINAIAIGANAIVDASNKVLIGNFDATSIGGQVGWTTFSDGRFKKNVSEDVNGLDFILKLRPVTYNLDMDALYAKNKAREIRDAKGNSMTKNLPKITSNQGSIRYTGFVAQEVEKTANELGYDFSGVDKPGNPDATYGLRYGDFVVPLVKAVQELSKKNDELEKRLAKLEALFAAQAK